MRRHDFDPFKLCEWIMLVVVIAFLILAITVVVSKGAPAPLARKATPTPVPAWLCVPHTLVWSGVRYRVEFAPDGTFQCCTDDGANYWQWRGRWEYREGVLVYREWSASRFGLDATPSLTITFDLSADGWRGRCGCVMRADRTPRKPDF